MGDPSDGVVTGPVQNGQIPDGRPPFGVRLVSTGSRAARVLVAGELDLATAERFDEAVTQALAEADDVVLDLSNVTFIDSTGLSSLLAGVSASHLRDRRLVISARLGAQPRRLFEVAGIEGALPLVDE
jgi:anti-sigma B factor antagonist